MRTSTRWTERSRLCCENAVHAVSTQSRDPADIAYTMPRRLYPRILLLCLPLALAPLAGCHMAEALSHDIEDASAYTGEKIASGGEKLADWVRNLND